MKVYTIAIDFKNYRAHPILSFMTGQTDGRNNFNKNKRDNDIFFIFASL